MYQLNKIGKELVLDLLNRDNELSLTFDDVVFHEPNPLIVPEGIRNTTLLVERKLGSDYRNSKQIKYWRLDLEKIVRFEHRQIPGSDIYSTLDLMIILNHLYSLQLTADDIIIEDIDTTNLPVEYTLKTNPLSYAYIGKVTLTLTNDLIFLGNVLKLPLLDDYLTRVLNPDLTDPILGEIQGFLPNLPYVPTENFFKVDNGDVQVGLAVNIGTDIGVGTDVTKPFPESIIEIPIGETTNWSIILTNGLIPTGRLPLGTDVLSACDVTMSILDTILSKQYEYTLGYHLETGIYEWRPSDRWFNDSDKPVPDISFSNANGVCHSYLDMYNLLLDSDRTDWALLGKFDITLSITPKGSIGIPSIQHNFTVIATPL